MHAYKKFLLTAGLLAATRASALIIHGGALPDVNERFVEGFPGAPVTNTGDSFLATGLDLSGIGWRSDSPQLGLTLISPQHFIITTHTAPASGSGVSFLSRTGAVKAYTVDQTYTVQHAPGVGTDITIGRLVAPIADTDQITSYPVLLLDSYTDYFNLPLLVYGQGGRMGRNTLDNLFYADMLPFGIGNGIVDSVVFNTDLDPISGESQGESGDSGSPSLYLAGSTLSLVGIHSAIDTAPLPDLTYDSFIPSYAGQINARLSLDGYALQVIPEPAAFAGLLGGAMLAWVLALRHRASGPARTDSVLLE